MPNNDPLAALRDDRLNRDRIHYEWMLASIARFRLFFAGLVFAILSFSIQFAMVPKANASLVNTIHVIAWLLLIAVGFLALRDAGGFVSKHTEETFNGLSSCWRKAMWGMFAIALLLLISGRILGYSSTHLLL